MLVLSRLLMSVLRIEIHLGFAEGQYEKDTITKDCGAGPKTPGMI